jgi:membrane protease YdiL (CAAX protease family)
LKRTILGHSPDAVGNMNNKAARERLSLWVFFLIAFGVPWVGWITNNMIEHKNPALDIAQYLIFPAACSVAGFVAAFIEGGWEGLRSFSMRVLNPRFSPWLWLLALTAPLMAGALTFLNHPDDLLGQGIPSLAIFMHALTFTNFLTGPLAEEFGWRGFLLGRLRRRFSPLQSGLIIGPIWVLWHLPLFYNNVFAHVDSTLKFLATIMAISVVITLIVCRTGGSVLPAVLTHWAFNNNSTIATSLFPALISDKLPGGIPFFLGLTTVATVLAIRWRSNTTASQATNEQYAKPVA